MKFVKLDKNVYAVISHSNSTDIGLRMRINYIGDKGFLLNGLSGQFPNPLFAEYHQLSMVIAMIKRNYRRYIKAMQIEIEEDNTI